MIIYMFTCTGFYKSQRIFINHFLIIVPFAMDIHNDIILIFALSLETMVIIILLLGIHESGSE